MNQEAHHFFRALKNDKNKKTEILSKLNDFASYLNNLCKEIAPNGFKENFIYHWTFKHLYYSQSNFNNYVKANLFASNDSLTRLKEQLKIIEINAVNRRMLIDFVCDLKPFITKFDKDQDYSWLVMNTNSHITNFYYGLSENIFLNGKPGNHNAEKLTLASSTPFVIRQSIEYKIKRILGIDYWMIDGKPDRNMMSKCFKAINENKKFYNTRDFDFEIVKQIYNWTQIYIHNGYRPQPWRTETALFCLKNLFYKGQASSSNLFSWYAGIEVLESDLPALIKNTEEVIKNESKRPIKIKWLSQPEVALIKTKKT